MFAYGSCVNQGELRTKVRGTSRNIRPVTRCYRDQCNQVGTVNTRLFINRATPSAGNLVIGLVDILSRLLCHASLVVDTNSIAQLLPSTGD